ncbi:MAG: hypothetical protein WD749_12545 [Phycisphaerales bacterium]
MSAAVPQCPRCGYDLSGLLASWTERCPLGATCAECGLVFDCGNVLSPRAIGPAWSFEHARTGLVRRFLATSRVSLHPWVLTRELSIDHQIRIGRLLLFAAVWLGGSYLALGLARAGLDPGPSWIVGAGLGGGGPAWYDWEFWGPRLRLIAMPYSEFHYQSGPGSWQWSSFPFMALLIVAYASALLMPMWMLVLGSTFRQASVRRVHLVRGFVYTTPGAVLALHAWIAVVVSAMLLDSPAWSVPQFLARLAAPLLTIGFLVWLTAWWWLFLGRYLRLRHTPAVALLMMFTSFLSVMTFFALLAANHIHF